MTQLLTIEKAAEKIGVTPRQIRHWITLGELEFMRIGRRIYLTEQHFADLIGRKTEKNVNGKEIELE